MYKKPLVWRILLLAATGPFVFSLFARLMDTAFLHDWLTCLRIDPGRGITASPDGQHAAHVVNLYPYISNNPFFQTQIVAVTLRQSSLLPDYLAETEVIKFDALSKLGTLYPTLTWVDNQHLEVSGLHLKPDAKLVFLSRVGSVMISIAQ